MVQFTAVLKKMGQQGEKTGWTYIDLDVDTAQALLPSNKKSFRVKGKLDAHPIAGVATIPMGEGAFIIAVNASMRKTLGKRQGESVLVKLELDTAEIPLSADLLLCLEDAPLALQAFRKLPRSHQNYYTRWIESAKTEATKAKRITQAIAVLGRGGSFGEAMRELNKEKAINK